MPVSACAPEQRISPLVPFRWAHIPANIEYKTTASTTTVHCSLCCTAGERVHHRERTPPPVSHRDCHFLPVSPSQCLLPSASRRNVFFATGRRRSSRICRHCLSLLLATTCIRPCNRLLLISCSHSLSPSVPLLICPPSARTVQFASIPHCSLVFTPSLRASTILLQIAPVSSSPCSACPRVSDSAFSQTAHRLATASAHIAPSSCW